MAISSSSSLMAKKEYQAWSIQIYVLNLSKPLNEVQQNRKKLILKSRQE